MEALLSVLAADGWATSIVRPTGRVRRGFRRSPAEEVGGHIVEAARRDAPPPPDASGRTEVHVEEVAAAVTTLLARPEERVRGLRVNCSDVFVTDAWLRRCADLVLNGEDPPLEDLRPPPGTRNVLGHAGLDRLGLELRGPAAVFETIRDPVAA